MIMLADRPRVDFTPSGKPVQHGGTGGGYSNYGCKCDECTEAHRARIERRRQERRHEEPPEHGRRSTYHNWGCRCDDCNLAAGHPPQPRQQQNGAPR